MTQQPPTFAADSERPALDDAVPAIDVRRYLGVIRKRVWIVLAVVAIGVTIAVIYTKRQPRVYRATASVIIDPMPPQVFGSQVQEVIQVGSSSYWSHQEYYNTQLQILTRFDLAEKTIRDNPPLMRRLLGSPEGDMRPLEEQTQVAADMLTGMLRATQSRESRVVNLHVEHTDPELAVELANAQIQTYVQHSRGMRREDGRDVTAFLARELENAERTLAASEQKLLRFKRDNDLLSVSLEDKQNLVAADLGRYSAALSDARIKRIELGSVRKRAQGLTGEAVMESPIFALASNAGVVDALKEQYLREKQRLAELAQELGPRHPQYQSQEQKVGELLEAIESEAKRAMRELDERYQASLAGEREFQAEVERLKADAFEIGPKTVEYNQYQRKFQQDEENYKLVLSRLNASQITGRNTTTNVSPHTQARLAVLVYPRLGTSVAVALMLSLMFGLGLAFLLELLDRTIKSPDIIERTVGAPLLGMIPVIDEAVNGTEREGRRSRDLYVFSHPTSSVAEHCRSIRTNILFSSASRPMRTLTISSPQQGEGKTTTTIYMGTIMAQSKQRVLLVDTDMRKPRLHRALLGEADVPRGLSNLLLPDTDIDALLDTVIAETEIPNLFVLPCGPRPPNPAELLLTERFREILRKLEERFDRVLLDSPPLMLMNDAVVLSRLSDGVVMVAQAGKTSIDDVSRSARMIRDVNAPILGVILNNMDISSREYGGYYRYGYDYGDKPADRDQDAAA